MNQLLEICMLALKNCNVEIMDNERLGVTLENGEKFEIIYDDEVVVEDDEASGGDWYSHGFEVEHINDCYDLLQACLGALSVSDVGKEITNISTDGGADDCEAIFCWNDDYVALKIR